MDSYDPENINPLTLLFQTEDKQYALPYANDPRKLFKIGVEFSKESRNIDRWLIE